MRKFPLLIGVIVLAVIVGAVLVVIFAAVEPEGNCKTPETQGECDRVIAEAAGVLAKKRGRIGGRSACIPKGTSPEELREVVVHWLEQNPSETGSDITLVAKALSDKFPCQ
jgi:Rap1a immunity proteins